MTRALFENGRVVTPEFGPVKYGLLQPLAMLPPYAAGRALGTLAGVEDTHRSGYRVTAFLFSPLVTAFAAAVSFRAARRLGAPAARAAALAWLLVFATLLLPYSRLLFAEPLNALLLLLFTGGAIRGFRTPGEAARGALSLALLVLNNPAFAPLFVGGAALAVAGVASAGGRRGASVAAAACGGIGLAAAGLTLAYNRARFGDAFRFGYEDAGFSGALREGLEGLVLSPARGLVWYAPLTVAAATVAVRLALGDADRRRLWVFVAATSFAYLFLYATWSSFEGGWCWGPRFLLPFVPSLHLALAVPSGRGPSGLPRVVAAIGALGLAAGAWEYASDWRSVEKRLFAERDGDAYRAAIFDAATTPALRGTADPTLLAQFGVVAAASALATRRALR